MATVPWEITHSVETNASLLSLGTTDDIANWDDPPAEFELTDRSLPVRTEPRGCRGRSRYAGSSRGHSANAATIELSLDGAALSFEWRL